MSTNIARQSLVTAFLTLTAVAVTALYVGQGGGIAPQSPVASPLGIPIAAFQASYPSWSHLLALVCILYTGLCLGRLSIRYNLYAGNCSLAIPFYGMAACGIVCGSDYLTQYLAALLLALTIKHFSRAFRNGYGFNGIFRASFYLGLLALISSAAIPLLLLLPLAVFLFRRTLRELAVALFGMLLPAFALCYITWAGGENFGAPLADLFTTLHTQIGLPGNPLHGSRTIVPLLTTCGLLLLTLTALAIQLQNMYAVSQKARLILVFCMCTFFLSLSTLLLPDAFTTTVAFAAVPSALLLPVFFVRAQQDFAWTVYVVLLVCTIVGIALQ